MGARMKEIVAAANLAVIIGCAFANAQPRPPAGSPQPASQQTGTPQAAAPSRLYGDSWYEFFLGQVNPDHLDRGAWIEQRRQMLLDATARNPYFKYSLMVTVL